MAKYYAPNLLTYGFQSPVKDKDILTPPGSPAIGDRYLIGGIGVDAWLNQDWNITMWDGTSWLFTIATEGMLTWVKDEDEYYQYDGTDWLITDLHSHANKALLDTYTQTEADLASAVSLKHSNSLDHTQGTDQGLDTGGANAVTAEQAKEAYTKRAVYNADLDCIEFPNL